MSGMLTFLRWQVVSEAEKTMQNGATAAICEDYYRIQFRRNLRQTYVNYASQTN